MRYGCTALQHLDSEIKLFAVSERERAANDVVREATALQKARASRFLFERRGSAAVFAREDSACALFFTARCDALDNGVRNAVRLEVLPDLRGAIQIGRA